MSARWGGRIAGQLMQPTPAAQKITMQGVRSEYLTSADTAGVLSPFQCTTPLNPKCLKARMLRSRLPLLLAQMLQAVSLWAPPLLLLWRRRWRNCARSWAVRAA